MDKRTKVRIGIGASVALLLAIAIGAAGAIAGARVLSANEESQAVIDDAAEQLGVEPQALNDALAQALKNRVDRAVELGRLTEEQGEELKERIDEGDAPFFGGFGHRGPLGLAFEGGASLEAAAAYLGLEEAELRERLHDGDTLAEIARAEGKNVDGLVDALVTAASERIDEAVDEGRLTAEHAAELEEDLEERMTDLVNGELRLHRFLPGRSRPDGEWRPFPGPRA